MGVEPTLKQRNGLNTKVRENEWQRWDSNPHGQQTRSLRSHGCNHWTMGSVENRDNVGCYARTLMLSSSSSAAASSSSYICHNITLHWTNTRSFRYPFYRGILSDFCAITHI